MIAVAEETMDRIAVRSKSAIGTTAWVAVCLPDGTIDGGAEPWHRGETGRSLDEIADSALRLLAEELDSLDASCSRFRGDSELFNIQRAAGEHVEVSPLLFEAISTACEVALMTAGTVDPTVGEAVSSLGYDRDFDLISSTARQELREPVPAPGWWRIELDPEQLTVLVPPGTSIDLGSSAKAFAADRAAEIISDRLGCGVLVNLGGDVAVSGNPPAGGWAVGIAQSCAAEPKSADQVVSIARGGLASSGISNRSWKRGGRKLHHIVDPATGDCAEEVWSLVSVAAPTCVEANAFSTASVVWGEDAPGILSSRGITARLVRPTGEVVSTGGWPEEGP